jgi:hypothetical protein
LKLRHPSQGPEKAHRQGANIKGLVLGKSEANQKALVQGPQEFARNKNIGENKDNLGKGPGNRSTDPGWSMPLRV